MRCRTNHWLDQSCFQLPHKTLNAQLIQTLFSPLPHATAAVKNSPSLLAHPYLEQSQCVQELFYLFLLSPISGQASLCLLAMQQSLSNHLLWVCLERSINTGVVCESEEWMDPMWGLEWPWAHWGRHADFCFDFWIKLPETLFTSPGVVPSHIG